VSGEDAGRRTRTELADRAVLRDVLGELLGHDVQLLDVRGLRQ
jgi:hypothetical protein